MDADAIIAIIERDIHYLTQDLTVDAPGSHMHGKLSAHPEDNYIHGKRDALIDLLAEIRR